MELRNLLLLSRILLVLAFVSVCAFGHDGASHGELERLVSLLDHSDLGAQVDEAAQVQWPEDDPDYLMNLEQNPHWCHTPDLAEVIESAKRAGYKMAPCELMITPCDNPGTRDATSLSAITINVYFHVIRGNGGGYGVSQATVNATVTSMNDYFSGTGIEFRLAGTRFLTDNDLSCIDEADIDNELNLMKSRYALNPDEQLNIYVSCSTPAQAGSYIAGSATIPQMQAYGGDDPLGVQGGLWLRDTVVGANSKTAAHEVGHCLGLWHTHVAISDIPYACSSDCYEYASGFEGDVRGDLCSDTPSTPVNFPNPTCSNAPGSDCQGTAWNSQPENMMGYASGCSSYVFTTQQARRMQCYARDNLAGWLHEEDTQLQNGVASNYSVSLNQLQSFTLSLPSNVTTFSVQMNGSNDADLYVKRTAINWPSEQGEHNSAEFKAPYIGGSNESVSFSNPASGAWNVYVHGYEASSGTVTASWQVGSNPEWHSASLSRSSPHPYGNGQTYEFTYSRSGAQSVAVHFNRLDTESGYDYVRVYDGNGSLVYQESGNKINGGSGSAFGRSDGWCIVNGSTMTVRLTTDGSVTDWGYYADGAAYYQ